MKKGLTELVFVLDRSGSMQSMTQDTIGGFNSMVEKQKKGEGEALVSLILFNSISYIVFDRTPVSEVPLLTEDEYFASGCTALIDALGGAIHHIVNVHKYAREEDRPEKTIFIITTDGFENASRAYDPDTVKKMILEQQEKYGWEFLFLGANIDAVETARAYGIREDRAVRFHNDKEGVALNYSTIAETVTTFRESGKIPENWSQEIGKDFKKRKRGKK